VPAEPDTDNLRVGPPLHDALLAFVPLVGFWDGTGAGVAPATEEPFRYRQSVRFAHDGRPFLSYEARAWLVEKDGAVIRPAWRESGFWRPGVGPDDVEVVLASNTGQLLLLGGQAGEQGGTQVWDLATAQVVSSPTAKRVDGERRYYAFVGGEISYATELAVGGRPFAAHLNATLVRRTAASSAHPE
jgi:THAP4-like, heme-binding beta-barrel domain